MGDNTQRTADRRHDACPPFESQSGRDGVYGSRSGDQHNHKGSKQKFWGNHICLQEKPLIPISCLVYIYDEVLDLNTPQSSASLMATSTSHRDLRGSILGSVR